VKDPQKGSFHAAFFLQTASLEILPLQSPISQVDRRLEAEDLPEHELLPNICPTHPSDLQKIPSSQKGD